MSENRDFEALLGNVMFAADTAAMDAAVRGLTHAATTREAVKAALECALGNGLISVSPREQWPEYIALQPPYEPGAPWEKP